ncbi:MAG: phage shock protein E [Paraglaciecola sp.]|jgi:phage shock protein E
MVDRVIIYLGELGVKIHAIICGVTLTIGMFFSAISYAGLDPVWIDVRSLLENKIDNIAGDIRMSHSDIVEEVSQIYPDKNTDIRLYCRSGGRAGKALFSLKHAGYNNVKNVGTIDDARKLRATNH